MPHRLARQQLMRRYAADTVELLRRGEQSDATRAETTAPIAHDNMRGADYYH